MGIYIVGQNGVVEAELPFHARDTWRSDELTCWRTERGFWGLYIQPTYTILKIEKLGTNQYLFAIEWDQHAKSKQFIFEKHQLVEFFQSLKNFLQADMALPRRYCSWGLDTVDIAKELVNHPFVKE